MKVFVFVRDMFRKFPVLLTITAVLAVSASIIEAVYSCFKDNSIDVGFIPAQYRGFCRH